MDGQMDNASAIICTQRNHGYDNPIFVPTVTLVMKTLFLSFRNVSKSY